MEDESPKELVDVLMDAALQKVRRAIEIMMKSLGRDPEIFDGFEVEARFTEEQRNLWGHYPRNLWQAESHLQNRDGI
jgi:hypothetical protein